MPAQGMQNMNIEIDTDGAEPFKIPEGIEIPEGFNLDSIKDVINDSGEDFEIGIHNPINMEEFMLAFFNNIKQIYHVFIERLRQGRAEEIIVVVVVMGLGIIISYTLLFSTSSSSSKKKVEDEEEEKIEPRDYTIDQLRDFDGSKDDKPILIVLKGDVYDVSSAKDLYGKNEEGSNYNCFAGRDATRAMAKLSFSEEELSKGSVMDDLSAFEREALENWVDKFKYQKGYPIRGRLSKPLSSQDKEFTRQDLEQYKGKGDVPKGRVHPPIYIGINGKVLDVSYGGYESYKEGGPYHLFAGKDASVPLGRMSFKPEDVENTDISTLSEEHKNIMLDWEKRFITTSKYPIVGKIVD